MTDARRQAAEEWAVANFRHNPEGLPGGLEYEDYVVPAHLAGQECGEQRAVEGICKRLRYWQKELNAAFDYAADIENGGWKEKQ